MPNVVEFLIVATLAIASFYFLSIIIKGQRMGVRLLLSILLALTTYFLGRIVVAETFPNIGAPAQNDTIEL